MLCLYLLNDNSVHLANIGVKKYEMFYNFRRKLDFWKLDKWEDDSRRRRRLIKDPNGHSHSDAVFHAPAKGVQYIYNAAYA